ncbi:MAG: PHP-associated domain-containing protein [Nanoarchaeota archaeon]
MSKIVSMDAHNHWVTSSNISARTAKEGVEKAQRVLGEDGIVGLIGYDSSPTKHDKRWSLFRKRVCYDTIDIGNGVYVPEKKIFVWHGQEVQTAEGFDVLVLGNRPKDHLCHGQTLKETLHRAKEVKAITINTSPAHKGGTREYLEKNPGLIEGFDGVETWNAEASWAAFGKYPEANKRAKEFYEKYASKKGLFEVAFSDGHSLREIGLSYTPLELREPYTNYVRDPERLNDDMLKSLKMQKENRRERTNTLGTMQHAFYLGILIAANKLGIEENEQLAPMIEKITLGNIRI